MSVSKYQMFLKTVECGSFSRAAEELNFTQSGVSHAVQALEDELGITLLSRNRGGVVLTAARCCPGSRPSAPPTMPSCSPRRT